MIVKNKTIMILPTHIQAPNGYFFSGLKKWFSKHRKAIITAIASAIAIATGQYYALNFILKGALVGFVAGATSTLVNGGSVGSALKNGIIGGLFGAVTAGFANGIGDISNFGIRALAHGASSSFMTRARGGRWSSGFWAGFVGTMLSPAAGAAKGFYGKLAANAVIGGTISQVTGGKFANGAWSGAFRFMFNEAMHKILKPSEYNYRVADSAQMEKKNIFDLDAKGLTNKLNINVVGEMEAYVLQNKLGKELSKIQYYAAGKATQSVAEAYYSSLKDFVTGGYIDRIYTGVDLLYSTVGSKSAYGFVYDCQSYSNCHVKGVYQK